MDRVWLGLGGNLQATETLLYYEGPVVMVMKTTTAQPAQTFLAQLMDRHDDGTEAYLLFAVSSERLTVIKRGDITLREATLRCEGKRLWQVTVDEDDLITELVRRTPQSLYEEELPGENARLTVAAKEEPHAE